MATYDMTPLDAAERIPIKIHIINHKLSINELKTISITIDSNVSELKFEIERALSVQQKHQQTLTIRSNDNKDNDDDNNNKKISDQELTSDDIKLSEYNITKNTIIELQLTDDSDWNSTQTSIDMASIDMAPTAPPTKTNNNNNNNTNNTNNTNNNNNNKNNNNNTGSVASATISNDEIIHFLTKHSKIQCRILLIVFEITLVLLVAYWGSVNMIQYGINMMFVLIAWRGCRKLKPFLMVCFLLYLILDIIIIFLLIILGLVEKHESVYGSTALYILLLTMELLLNSIWLYFYCKFFYAVLKSSEGIRERARSITSKQPILI